MAPSGYCTVIRAVNGRGETEEEDDDDDDEVEGDRGDVKKEDSS